MTKMEEPEIDVADPEDFTRVTFKPDLVKFGMKRLDDEIVGLMARRALDIAATTKGVKVFLNGEVLPCQTFTDYVNFYKSDNSLEPLKMVFDQTRRWQVGVTVSDRGFQQVSFVNSVWTVRGGRHVDYVVDQITEELMKVLKPKMEKKGVPLKLHQIKNNLFVFINCQIENPAFDSQTKETLTTKPKLFGSEWHPDSEFIKKIVSSGVLEASSTYAKKKHQEKEDKKNVYIKASKIMGKITTTIYIFIISDIPQLVDANFAGTSRSKLSTLILTEGESAKSMAISGMSVLGRDRYGVFPLKGKLLNVREATYKQVQKNVEVNALVKILGLEYKKTYEKEEERDGLRYGKVMIMADQVCYCCCKKSIIVNLCKTFSHTASQQE